MQRKERIPLLKIKVVGGPAYGQIFVRNPLDVSKHHVLGRVEDCDILINDPVLSKHHCTFQYVHGLKTVPGAADMASSIR